jgi:hypothetical protein
LIDDSTSPTQNYWTNDGSSVTAGAEPTNAISITVSNGVYNVILGDTGITNMTVLDKDKFENQTMYLRVWFSTSGTVGTFEQITPDKELTSSPYALSCDNVKETISENLTLNSGSATEKEVVITAYEPSGHSGGLKYDIVSHKWQYSNNGGSYSDIGGGGSGTVTSVGLSLPSEISISGSPVISSGTITGTWASQSAGMVFSSPAVSAGTPSFRALAAADIPSLNTSKLTAGTLGVARGGTGAGTFSANYLLKGNSTSAVASSIIYDDGTRIGIGTTSPNEQLELTGYLRLPDPLRIYSGSNVFLHSSISTNNLSFGTDSGNTGATGNYNISIGYTTLNNVTTGGGNIAIGTGTLAANNLYYDNVAVGYYAMNVMGTGTDYASSTNNVAIGNNALQTNNPTSDSNGRYNVAVGYHSLTANTIGCDNTAVGCDSSDAVTEGNDNTALGYNTLHILTTGSGNTAIGSGAGANDYMGSNCTFVGYGADFASSASHVNATAVGYNAKVGASNSLVLGGIGSDAVNVGIGTTAPARTLHIVDVMRLEPRASAPTSPSAGDLYVSSGTSHIYCYLGGSWRQLD